MEPESYPVCFSALCQTITVPKNPGMSYRRDYYIPILDSKTFKNPIPKGNSSSNHPFLGAFAVRFREGK